LFLKKTLKRIISRTFLLFKKILSMQAGMGVLEKAGVLCVMDESTHAGFKREIQSLVLSEERVLVVPDAETQTRHSLMLAAKKLKKERSRGVLSLEVTAAYSQCVHLVMVGQARKFANGKLPWCRASKSTDFFIFLKAGGRVNFNVLCTKDEAGVETSSAGDVLAVSTEEFVSVITFFGTRLGHEERVGASCSERASQNSILLEARMKAFQK